MRQDAYYLYYTPSSAQAFWLGIFATFGQSARVIGPMLVTDLYQIFGTYALFGDVAATLVSGMLLKKRAVKENYLKAMFSIVSS